ncbi:IS481 family transposase [Nesterenkonia sp. YGD6]|uniref:IS481 family transposase n=1 Tax=Nesterenkonia sp. YGD6 TaxID=2901231 RepID=UPI001F4D1892|nr:IS481 family transposase [Nesterenkonia sp. YGD6]
MSHNNARLTLHGRALLVDPVINEHRPVAHVAKELGISRQCAHRWVTRFRAEGLPGLRDRSSRPHTSPSRTHRAQEMRVLEARQRLRAGPLRIAAVTGTPARTVSRILSRHDVAPLAWCDPLTGQLIRASRVTGNRYERDHPGELVHIDVKKLGRIPDGGGWRAHGRSEEVRGRGIGFDYIHAVIDDHSRLAYAEIHADEKASTCAAVLLRAAEFFQAQGIPAIERVLSDNALAYRRSSVFRAAVVELGAVQRFIRPRCPWTNGKIERFNRTLAAEWAYSQVFTSNAQRAAALAPWLLYYNTDRIHTGIGMAPAHRVSPTS